MTTGKFLLYAALGTAAVLLLTSDRAKEMREKLEEQARENAKRWKDKLSKLRADGNGVLADLQEH
jgi:gas vesicle protein